MNLKALQQTRVERRAPSLSCAWIATGNPRQPLACVWIDNDVMSALEATGTSDPSASLGEENLGGLAA